MSVYWKARVACPLMMEDSVELRASLRREEIAYNFSGSMHGRPLGFKKAFLRTGESNSHQEARAGRGSALIKIVQSCVPSPWIVLFPSFLRFRTI